ncbi:MAG: hypothetical protein JHC33_02360, partial [Ignisphaera sp.]|nr:hypothetical protein [Ignisphaera sp.]
LEAFFNQSKLSSLNTNFDYSQYVQGLVTYKAVKFILGGGTEIIYNFDNTCTNTSSVAVIFNQINTALSLHSDVIKNTGTNSVQYRTLDDSIVLFDSNGQSSNIQQVVLIATNNNVQTFDWFSSTSSLEFLANNYTKATAATAALIDTRNQIQTIANSVNATLDNVTALAERETAALTAATTALNDANTALHDSTVAVSTANALVREGTTALTNSNALVNSLESIVNNIVKLEWSDSILTGVANNIKIGEIPTTTSTLKIAGDVAGIGTFASGINLTLAASGVTADTYTKVTVDAKGRVTGGTTLSAADIPTITASKITDLQSAINATPLNFLTVPNASVNLNNKTIINLATPINDTDAVNKKYVDSTVQGLTPKQSVKAATTANIGSLSGVMTIDGVSVVAGDRVLVKDQTTQSQNGIYIVSTDAWIRSSDADTWSELINAYCFVDQGLNNEGLGFVCSIVQGGTLDVTNIVWIKFSTAGVILAGNGLKKSSNTLSVLGTPNRVSVDSTGIDIASDYIGQESITTLGTITSGTWNGSVIDLAHGGTGADLSNITNGAILKKSATSLVVATAGIDYYNNLSIIDGGTF